MAHEVQDEAEARLADMLAKQKRGSGGSIVASQKLRAAVADLAEGIVSQQELEEENERLVELTNASEQLYRRESKIVLSSSKISRQAASIMGCVCEHKQVISIAFASRPLCLMHDKRFDLHLYMYLFIIHTRSDF